MDGVFDRKYNSLQDEKHEARVRSWRSWIFVPVAFGTGYYFRNVTAGGVLAVIVGALILWNLISPLSPQDEAFEKVYRALKLSEQTGGGLASRRRIHGLLKSAYDLSRGEGFVIKEATDLRDTTWDLFRRAALPAALRGHLSHSTIFTFAQVLSTPSLENVRILGTQMANENYVEISEVSVWKKGILSLLKTPLGRFVLALFGSLMVGFGIALGAALAWATLVPHQSFSEFANNTPAALPAIFSLGGIITVGLFPHLRKL